MTINELDAIEKPAIRIYWITDLHFKDEFTGLPDAEGAVHRERHYYAAEDKLRNAVDIMNEDRPDWVVCTGDITDSKQPYASFTRLWKRIAADKDIVIGNHDTPNGYDSIVSQLGYGDITPLAGSVFNCSRVLEKDGIQVKAILLDTNIGEDGVHLDGGVEGTIQKDAFEWLERELTDGTEGTVLLFTHNGLGGPSRYFNQEHVRQFIDMVETAAAGKELMVINLAGHHHVHPIATEKQLSAHLRFVNGVAMIAGESSFINVVEIDRDGNVKLSYKEVGYPYIERERAEFDN